MAVSTHTRDVEHTARVMRDLAAARANPADRKYLRQSVAFYGCSQCHVDYAVDTIDYDRQTIVTITGGNPWTGTLAEWFREDDGVDYDERAHIRMTLRAGRTYIGGGGAQPVFSVRHTGDLYPVVAPLALDICDGCAALQPFNHLVEIAHDRQHMEAHVEIGKAYCERCLDARAT